MSYPVVALNHPPLCQSNLDKHRDIVTEEVHIVDTDLKVNTLFTALRFALNEYLREENDLVYSIECILNFLLDDAYIRINVQTSKQNVPQVYKIVQNILSDSNTFMLPEYFDRFENIDLYKKTIERDWEVHDQYNYIREKFGLPYKKQYDQSQYHRNRMDMT